MSKPLKILLAVVGAVVLLVAGAVVFAATLFDPNDYRDKITAAVKEQTGRDLTLGQIDLNVFPWLNVGITDLVFSNAEGFGDEPMASVTSASVGVEVLPLLLDRQVKISNVSLADLSLNLARNSEGQTNWDDIAGGKQETAEPEEDAETEEAGPGIEGIDIAGVALKNANIVFSDAQAGKTYRLQNVNLQTGNLKPGEATDIEASLHAIAEAEKLSAKLNLSATVLADMIAQRATVDNLRLDVVATGDEMEASANLAANIAANLETQNVQVAGMTLDFKASLPDVSTQGKLSGELTAGLQNQQYKIAGLLLDAGASGEAIPGGTQALKFGGDATVDLAKDVMSFKNGKINAAGVDIETAIEATALTSGNPSFSGPLTIKPFSPRDLLTALGQTEVPTLDPTALKTASLSTQLAGSSKAIRLKDLAIKLDQTNIVGHFAVRDIAAQAVEFALKVDDIDVDRYTPPTEEHQEEPADKKQASGEKKSLNATEIPANALEPLNASGTLDIAKLKIKGATVKNVRVKIDGPKDSPKIVKLDANAFGGQIATTTKIEPGSKPKYALNTSISTMQLAPLLKTFAGKDYVAGLGNIKLDLSSAGNTVGDARQALNGNVALNFENGAVKGMNIGQTIRKARATLKGETFTPDEPEETDFSTFTFAASIVNGILKSNQLDAASPLLRLTGNGEIDLVNETINYLASPTIVGTSKGQGGKSLQDLAGITVPIKLTGSLFSPQPKLDLKTALKQEAEGKLRAKAAEKLLGKGATADGEAVSEEQLKQKASEKLSKELGRGLNKLFGGGSKE